MTDLCALGAVDLIRLMREGTSTARELMQAHVDQIEAAEPTLRAWAYLDLPAALSAATAADAQRRSGATLGPLHGLPVGVKDIIDTANMPTTFGTRVHAGRQPTADATIVARLRAAGAIVVGKTVTSEYALYIPGPTGNPHDPARSPGGSSSGSAAAVAAKMVPAALATQTNGSTIRPASFCGIVGYKPSLGLLPRTGVLRQVNLMDHPGLMARSVADVALLARVLGGRDPLDELSFEPSPNEGIRYPECPPRLGLVCGPYWSRAEAGTRAAIESFVAGIEQTVDDVILPDVFSAAADLATVLMETGIAEAFHADAERSRDLMPELVMQTMERGRTHSAVELLAAQAERGRLRRLFDSVAQPYDALITPAATGTAPARESGTGDPIFSTLWSLIGVPAISLPLLQGEDGLPPGVQLVTGSRRDDDLLRVAAWLTHPRP